MLSARNWSISASLAIFGSLCVALGLASLPEGHFASPSAIAAPPSAYICMTDDGYGRRRPCSANYKAANPNWRGSNDCFTDDGYGRRRPCSANYKARHKK
jgi:hypothetical protein